MTEKGRRISRSLIQLAGIIVLTVVDRLIKNAVYVSLPDRGTIEVIPGFLGLSYAENTGAAFSLFSSSTTVLSVITGVLILAGLAILFAVKNKPLIYDICIPLIIAGGAGNQLDRLTRGFVIDYIKTLFIDFPIFNFADCLITCSCIAVIVYLIYDIIRDSSKKTADGEKND
ncbi:MAG: signal peptidase II [Oscillospiraceae bacterium]|nr:signal peptidase II [Oscillospiraceae bacterium]